MIIPKNTLIRDKMKSEIKKENDFVTIQKITEDELQGTYKLRRRLNQMIKKRCQSMLTESSVDINEVGDILELINERLIMEGKSLEDGLKVQKELNKEFGSYHKHFTTSSSYIETEVKGFIPYVERGRVLTDKEYISRVDREKYGKYY